MKKVLLQSMISENKEILVESNIANSGNTSFTIELSDSDDYIKVNSFDVIYERFLLSIKSKLSRSEKTKVFFERQFKKWIINDIKGYVEVPGYPSIKRLMDKLYPNLNDFMDDIISDNPDINRDDIKRHLPDFIKKNPDSATIFCNGKKFGFKYIKNGWEKMIEELIDYLTAADVSKGNTEIIPNQLHISDISKVSVPDAIQKASQWHIYIERQGEKIDDAKATQMIKSLKQGQDYEMIKKFKSGYYVVKALNSSYTDAEGKIMKHCVASYGADIDSKRVEIYSFWDKQKLPRATMEIQNNKIQQIKGRHNGIVEPKDMHKDIVRFIIDNKLEWGNTIDQNKVDWKKISKEFAKQAKENPDNQEAVEEAETDVKTKSKFKDFLQHDDQLPSAKQDNLELDTRSKEETNVKLAGITMDETSLGYLLSMDLDLEDEISDEEAQALANIDITKPDINTLPAVISKSLMAVGEVKPEFNMVRNLPGYLKSGIRSIGREVFKPFTSTKIEDIQVIANVNGQGPNEQKELNAVIGFMEKHGTNNSNVIDMSFIDKIPGYEAKIKVYTYANYTFMAVQDHAGSYVYSWPSTDTKAALKDDSIKYLE